MVRLALLGAAVRKQKAHLCSQRYLFPRPEAQITRSVTPLTQAWAAGSSRSVSKRRSRTSFWRN